ncbi:uncharacterized protein LOC115446754 [Manduca sexta]|uniref:uncharacterized protein LOC115446754 n=1 Tax=Manduca sexta TaxID=7130 RepID=UPI001183E938|nr:uncharacterized protein LOC115446754 [Manduca sexta]
MGSNASKTTIETAVVQKNEADIINNPDPRSPTPEITRTPLQGKTGGKHNITKNVDLRKTFECAKGEEKLIHNNPILSAVIKNHLQSYDPRSPTQDFERTPIIIASNIDIVANDKKQLENVNCASPQLPEDVDNDDDICRENNNVSLDLMVPKNLCNGFYDMTLNDTLKENEEPLGSSTVSKEAIEDNISNTNTENKPTTLLETNFDYVEFDNNKLDETEKTAQSLHDFETTQDDIKCIPVFKILDHDPRSPSIGIDRTPIVVPKNDEHSSSENVEEMSDDTLIKVLQTTNAELRQTMTKPQNTNTDGLLIYEDESTSLSDTPKKVKQTNNNNGSRTPLSCMKNKADVGHARSKSANTLFDPKNQKLVQSKIPKRISHIPRLKTLSKQAQLLPSGSSISLKNMSKSVIASGDCENTPPHSHRDRWDKDNSIVL